VSGDVAVADARLSALLAAWPRSIPLVVELQDQSWHVDETLAALRAAGAVLCTTELPPEGDEGATPEPGDGPGAADTSGPGAGPLPPIIRRTGSFLYLRLRRHDYTAAEIEAWAQRVEPFLAAGDDAYVFFRHDAVGRAAELALQLKSRLEG
jgi:uncharacterized protein YecE (DUF72 family)